MNRSRRSVAAAAIPAKISAGRFLRSGRDIEQPVLGRTVKLFLALLSFCLLPACGTFSRGGVDGAQAEVDKRYLGTPVGDFFERYGAPLSRDESRDGIRSFVWEGGATRMPAGVRGLEEVVCRVRLTSDKAGRIVSATILRDATGEKRYSRCLELLG